MGTKTNPGPFDCYTAAGENEPIFVLLARDPDAPIIVELWALLREHNTKNKTERDREKIAEARRLANEMRAWKLTQ